MSCKTTKINNKFVKYNKLNGKTVCFHNNKTIRKIGYNINGKLNGRFLWYYGNGDVNKTVYYIDGKLINCLLYRR